MSDIEFGVIGNTLDYYFEEQFSFVQELQKHLLTWVNSIALNNVKIIKGSLINYSSDFFLTFNYTSVLEQVYNICSDRICHIHGGLFPYCYITPVIGHGNHKSIEHRQQWKKECDEQFDEAGSSVNLAFIKYYTRTLKDTKKALFLNKVFLISYLKSKKY